MNIGIDVDALNAHAATLKQQLADVEAVLRIVSKQPVTEREPSIVVEIEKPKPQPPRMTNKVQNRGARKAVLLALHTGALGAHDLARGLVWPQALTNEVLGGAEDAALVERSTTGIWGLTDKGRVIARWFIDNPAYQMYTPWRGNCISPKAAK